jgi:hypothetical protein
VNPAAESIATILAGSTYPARKTDDELVEMAYQIIDAHPELRPYGLSNVVDALSAEIETRLCGAP